MNWRLLLFYTGITRDARDVLTKQRASTEQKIPVLRKLCEMAYELRDVLTSGTDLNAFGRGLHRAWEAKKSLEVSICNPLIDALYEEGAESRRTRGKTARRGQRRVFFVRTVSRTCTRAFVTC